MGDAVDLQLVKLLQQAPGQKQYRTYLALERLFAEALGGQVDQNRNTQRSDVRFRRPDIVVQRHDSTTLAIELKLFSTGVFKQNLRNRIAELLSTAVELRRSYRGEVTLAAIILIVAGVDDDSASRTEDHHFHELVERLLRSHDDVGFDSVLVGTATQEIKWRFFRSAEDLSGSVSIRPASTQEALSVLRSHQARALPHATTQAPVDRLHRFLLVSDEWRSGQGGISTLNRELAIALSAAGFDATVMVPHASSNDIKAASEVDVAIVTPAVVPGLTKTEPLLLRPVFADSSWEPDVVIGHGRLLGPYAAAQQQQFFPLARRVHFVHTDAEQLEAAKEELGGDSRMLSADARRRLELDLAQSADLVVGVGPLLADTIRDELIGRGPDVKVISLMPGLRSAFSAGSDPSPIRNHVLIVGRADDFQSKGIDIAAEAMLRIVDRWPPSKPHQPVLVIRGVPDAAGTKVKERLDSIMEGRVTYHLRPYSDSESDVTRDLAQARLLLMPSRHEGFGLAAFEAIASGVPVLISAESGLAQFLRECSIDTTPSSVVSTRDSIRGPAVDNWADAIEHCLTYPSEARIQALELRESLSRLVDWDRSVSRMLEALRTP